MQRLAKFIGTVAGVILVAAALQPARAITLQTGDNVTFNYDFTGQAPPPPYTDGLVLDFNFANVDPGDSATFHIFGGLDGSGASLFTIPIGQLPLILLLINLPAAPDVQDGVFSVEVIAGHGPFDIIACTATELNVDNVSVTIPCNTSTSRAPEPATLALLGLGLAGLGFSRRRKLT